MSRLAPYITFENLKGGMIIESKYGDPFKLIISQRDSKKCSCCLSEEEPKMKNGML